MSRSAGSRSFSRLVLIVILSLLITGTAYAQSPTTTYLNVLSAQTLKTSSVLGQEVMFEAVMVAGVPWPTGTVVISTSDGTVIGILPLVATLVAEYGIATIYTASLPAGSYNFVATYSGDGNNSPSTSSPVPFTVGLRSTTTVVNSVSPSTTIVVGQTATVGALVTDAATTGPANLPIEYSLTSGAGGAFVPAGIYVYLQTNRTGHTATPLLDGTVLITGGMNGSSVLQSAEINCCSRYLSTASFSTSSYNLQTARTGHTATLAPNGNVVIIGGSSTGDSTGLLNSAEVYTSSGGFSTMGVTLQTARMGHSATLLSDGNILVVGGTGSSGALKDVELCNNGGCTDLGNILGEARTGHTATWLGSANGYDYILVTGGDGFNDGEVLAYALASQTVTSHAIAGLPTARTGHSAVMLPDGTVLLLGGEVGGSPVNTADLCQIPSNPTTMQGSNCVSTSSTMSTARTGQTATLLTTALVMVTGGSTSGSSVEYYTPSFDPLGTVTPSTTGATTAADSTALCTLSLNGSGATNCNTTVTPTGVGTGTRNVTLEYPGDTNHLPSASSGTDQFAVTKGTPTVTVTDAGGTYNGSPFSATGVAIGAGYTTLTPAVTFSYSGTGRTTYGPTATAPTNVGTYTVTASFAGNANYTSGSSTAVAFTISQANQTVFAITGPASVTYGVGATATTTGGSGAGAVTFSASGGGCVMSGGSLAGMTTVTVNNASLPCTLTATKAGGINYNAITSSPYTVTLVKANQAALTITGPASVTYGATATAAATGGSGTGALTFSAGSSTGCSVNTTSGLVSVSNASRTCTLTATKATDNNYTAITSAAYTVTLNDANQTALTITGPVSVTYGATATAATTGGSGAGAITFAATGSTGCSVNATTGVVSVTNASGTCKLTVTKAADNDYTALTSATYAVTLVKAGVTSDTLQTTAATVLLKNNVTLTAKVTSTSGTPTGSVNFMDGTTSLGSGTLDNTGTATLTLSTLTAGSHSLTAVYGGDSNFNGITSTALSETVQDFQLAINGGSGGGSGTVLSTTVLPGGVATYQIQLSPTNGSTFPSGITLTLSGLPAGATYTITLAGATCTNTPCTIAAGSGAQTVTVQVQTPRPVAGLRVPGTRSPILALAMLLPMFGMVRLRRAAASRQKRIALVLLLLLAVGTLGMGACGGGGSGFMNQAPQTYIMQLNATSGALQHSTNLSLTIQ